MTRLNASDPETMKGAKLPRLDWILLPGLSLLTINILAGSIVLMAGWLYPSSAAGLDGCFGKGDTSGDARAIPNSVCSERIVESEFVAEYRFNTRGDRAGMEYGPKPPGTYRIVMIGSSMAMGSFVPRERTFAALLPTELSGQTGRKVELYNEARGGRFRGGAYPTQSSALQFDEVLSASPDLILWIVTPADVGLVSFENFGPVPRATAEDISVPGKRTDRLATLWNKLKVEVAKGSLMETLRDRWERTTTSLVLKHLLYQSESQGQYVTSYLENQDDAGFLKAEPSAKWQRLLGIFQIRAAEIEGRARAAGVPLAVVLVPNRAQAAMISMGEWPAGYDPYKLGEELRAIVVSQGGTYIDILPDFRKSPNPERHYFPVDGHPDAGGHKIIADFLATELTSGAIAPLRVAVQPHAGLEQGR